MGSIAVDLNPPTLYVNRSMTSSGPYHFSDTTPEFPYGVTAWTSIIISGHWEYSGGNNDNISELYVNAQLFSGNSGEFSVECINTIRDTDVYTFAVTGGKKSNGTKTVSFSNLKITYYYDDPVIQQSDTLYLKQSGVWVPVTAAYKKVGGTWVLQEDLSSVFHTDTKYIKVD